MGKINLKKCSPDADIREYYFFWYPDVPDNCNQCIVGEIRNTTNEKIALKICVDNGWMNQRDQRHCALFADPHDYLGNTFIFITNEYFRLARNEDLLIAFLWHEMGHYQTMKYFPEYTGDNLSKLRKEYIANGRVHPSELVADLMAAYYSGVDNTVAALRVGARERLKLAETGEQNASKGWWEYRMRRQIIQKFTNDEEIEAEICRLCGVEKIDEV